MIVDIATAAHHQAPVLAAGNGLADETALGVDFGLQLGQRLRPTGGDFRRLKNMVVARAAAVVAAQGFAQFLFGELPVGMAMQKIPGAHHHARRAVAALHGMTLHEGLLNLGEFAVFGHAFSGQHVGAVGLHRQHQAGFDRVPVHRHRAGATGAFFAAKPGPGEPRIPAQEIGEQGAAFHAPGHRLAVHVHRNLKSVLSHGEQPRSGSSGCARAVHARAVGDSVVARRCPAVGLA